MTLKTRKFMLGDLRKIFGTGKEPEVPAMPRNHPVGVPAVPRKE